jgi:hypothetical protein
MGATSSIPSAWAPAPYMGNQLQISPQQAQNENAGHIRGLMTTHMKVTHREPENSHKMKVTPENQQTRQMKDTQERYTQRNSTPPFPLIQGVSRKARPVHLKDQLPHKQSGTACWSFAGLRHAPRYSTCLPVRTLPEWGSW